MSPAEGGWHSQNSLLQLNSLEPGVMAAGAHMGGVPRLHRTSEDRAQGTLPPVEGTQPSSSLPISLAICPFLGLHLHPWTLGGCRSPGHRGLCCCPATVPRGDFTPAQEGRM